MAFRSLMFQGTGSSVGKSLLTAAFCRIFKDDGFDVVPFKAQNMSLNSFVTPEGSEIGRAQALQALAARVSPSFDMNPILIKPEADTQSQIVVKGSPWKTLAAGDYYTYREQLWDVVTSSLDRLKKEHELILIEGAGSPAEINFAETEIVNMSVARYLDSPVILVGNIDMGGVFASLVGTLSLLQPEQRQLIKGFIINKFRGDERLLRPGLDQLSELTEGRPVLGVV
ncbi:MAG TPA: cobyric acid synthase, partial [Spirochaetia bacterium]|nr:cobyric acid synthase [Spirochaetia bacterium]